MKGTAGAFTFRITKEVCVHTPFPSRFPTSLRVLSIGATWLRILLRVVGLSRRLPGLSDPVSW